LAANLLINVQDKKIVLGSSGIVVENSCAQDQQVASSKLL